MYKVIIFLSLFLLSACKGEQFSGYGTAIDGDGILLNNNIKIRLWGIDAPEYQQPCYHNKQALQCGYMAKAFLNELIKGEKISCIKKDEDRYGRIVAICYKANHTEINKQMVAQGWALDYTYYSAARYRLAEYKAKRDDKGLWQYDFELPFLWRKNH